MDGNTVSVLQQLVSNPQLVRQLKDVLSILAPQNTSSVSAASETTATSETPQDLISSSSSAVSPVLTLGRGTPSATPALAAVPHTSHAQSSVSASTATTASQTPASMQTKQNTRKPTVASATQTSSARTSSNLPNNHASVNNGSSSSNGGATSGAPEEELRARREEIDLLRREGERRAREWEAEARRLGQQIEQLTHTVAEQRLRMAEMKHSYEAALLRKDEAHEAAMKQLMQVHRDGSTVGSAAPPLASPILVSQAGLSENAKAINTRTAATATTTTHALELATSNSPGQMSGPEDMSHYTAYKRPREPSTEAVTKEERNGTMNALGRPSSGAKKASAVTSTAKMNEYEAEKAMNTAAAEKKRAPRPGPLPTALTTRIAQQQQQQQMLAMQRRRAAQKSLTPPPSSASFVRGRRRTPRTPSLTNADRIIAASESSANSRSRGATLTTPSPQVQGHPPPYLAGYAASIPSPTIVTTTTTNAIASNVSSSLRLDSPTPVAVQSRLQPRVVSQYNRNATNTYTTNADQTVSDGRTATRSDTISDSKNEARGCAKNNHPSATAAAEYDMARKAQRFVEHYGGPTAPSALAKPTNATSAPALANNGAGAPHEAKRAAQNKPHTALGKNNNNIVNTTPAPQSARSATSSAVGGGPTRSPSPLNPKRGPALPRRFIFTGLKDNEPERLREAIERLGDDACALDGDLDEPPPFHTTHIVLRGTPRSVKALCGVVSGKWLVAPEYIYNSAQAGFWLDEFDEGGLRIFPPPLKCQRFVLTIEHEAIRSKLAQVIEYGGGEVVVTSTATSRTRSRGSAGGGNGGRPSVKQLSEQGIIVITSGDDLLRYATQQQA